MTSLLQKINTLDTKVDGLDSSNLQTQITTNTDDISTLQTSKQNTLTAGDNITIVNNVISSTGGGSGTDIGFLAYHNSSTDYSAIRLAPYNLVRYNTGNAYDNSTYIFTVPVAGKYYFYATYFTKASSTGVLDLRIKKTNQVEETLIRGQEGQTTPGKHEKRQVSVIVECVVGDQLYAVIRYNTLRLSILDYSSTDNTIYGPYGCQLLT